MTGMKIFKILIYFILPTLILLCAVTLLILNRQKNSVAFYDPAPRFKLTEQSGKELNSEDLKGRPWLAGFIFTRCQGQCPIISEEMSQIAKEFKKLRMMSFSVDPDYDSPRVLSKYAERFDADPAQWSFVTGPRDVLNHVTTGFHMNTIDDPMFHSASVVLVDGQGRVRGYYDANDAEKVEKLKRDIKIISERT